mgnify:CR=1 FL=1
MRWSDSKHWNSDTEFGSDVMLSFGVFDSGYMQSFPCVSFAAAYALPIYNEDLKVVYQSLADYQRKNLTIIFG